MENIPHPKILNAIYLKWASCLVCELFPNKTINSEKLSGQAGLCSGPSLRQQVG